jgi:hypothetical protein
MRHDGRIAQLVEQLTLNQRVHGSSPCAPTIEIKDLASFFTAVNARFDSKVSLRFHGFHAGCAVNSRYPQASRVIHDHLVGYPRSLGRSAPGGRYDHLVGQPYRTFQRQG